MDLDLRDGIPTVGLPSMPDGVCVTLGPVCDVPGLGGLLGGGGNGGGGGGLGGLGGGGGLGGLGGLGGGGNGGGGGTGGGSGGGGGGLIGNVPGLGRAGVGAPAQRTDRRSAVADPAVDSDLAAMLVWGVSGR
jgi:hypothetical protein